MINAEGEHDGLWPLPWERSKMTVCIAADCRDGEDHAVVLCTDWKVSGVLGSAETALKERSLGRGWICLTSGYESDINCLVQLISQQIQSTSEIHETNILNLIRKAIHVRKKDKADEYTIGKYAIYYDDFLRLGRDKFPI